MKQFIVGVIVGVGLVAGAGYADEAYQVAQNSDLQEIERLLRHQNGLLELQMLQQGFDDDPIMPIIPPRLDPC